MVVAAGAGNRQAQKGFGEGVDLFVQNVVDHPQLVLLSHRFGSQGQKTGGHDRPAAGLMGSRRREQIARYLLDDEPVVGHVGVERVDHVIPVAPGFRKVQILIQPGRVGIASDVQPMPPPSLTVSGRGQQAIDQPGEGSRGRVRKEFLDLIYCRRQTMKVEFRSPQQGQPGSLRGRGETVFFQPGQHDGVDRVMSPSWVFRAGCRRKFGFAKGPPSAAGLLTGGIGVPVRPGIDPPSERLDVSRRQGILIRRHPQIPQVCDSLIEQTGPGVTRDQSRASGASLENRLPVPQIQSRHLSRTMTAQTVLLEDAPHLLTRR